MTTERLVLVVLVVVLVVLVVVLVILIVLRRGRVSWFCPRLGHASMA